MKKQLTSFLLIIALVITMVPMVGITAFAASDSTTIDVSDSSSNQTLPTGVIYDDAMGVFTISTGSNSSTITVTGETTTNNIVVHGGVNVTLVLSGASITVPTGSHFSPIDLQGNADVTLELAEGTTSTVSAIGNSIGRPGIHVASASGVSATLTVTGAGILNATGDNGCAGIGGGRGESGGNITINSGTVAAACHSNSGAGIGGGADGEGGNITVNGGIVIATGDYNGAGIGGGASGAGGRITIRGGTVTTTGGGDAGAGIGGGASGAGGCITISGGTVTATGGPGDFLGGGAGIGGGRLAEGGTITINDGTVTATGGAGAGSDAIYGGGAGIGGGTGSAGGDITINGGTVTTTGGGFGGAGIGGGGNSEGGTITINGGTVTATGSSFGGAGIGGGHLAEGGTITINDGTVRATGGWNSAGVGGGYRGTSGSITISGGTVNATSGAFGAGIGGGANSDSGDIIINGGTVNAFGLPHYGGAGIGGGVDGDGGNITINGGTVNATGGVGGTDAGGASSMGGAGIGGGSEGAGGNIEINGGTVTATGDHNGAGIGGGRLAEGGNITINGGTVTAIGGESGCAGIGGGGMAMVGPAPTGGSISINASAVVKAVSKGNGNPAINAVGGSGGSVINAKLDNAISAGSDTYLKCSGNVLKLPANYKDFAFSVAAASPISAWSDPACTAIVAGIVTTPGGIANIPLSATIDAVPTPVTTGSAFALTVNLDGGNGTAASGSYASGAVVSIDARTKSGYTFTNWTSSNGGSFGSAGSAATTFTMPGNATTIAAVLTQNSTGGGGGGGGSQTAPGKNIIIDGENFTIGDEDKNGDDTTVTIDQNKLTNGIAEASDNSGVIIPITGNTNVTALLVVKNIEEMAKKDMTLTVQTGKISYNINTSAIDTVKITASLGMTDTSKIPFDVHISNSNAVVNGTSVIVSPVEFMITSTYNGRIVNVDKFSSFVDRAIEITADQAKKITTAVVVEPNGSLRHVPTKVSVVDGKYYAVINSLTNSTYTVIWHPVEFSDVAAHWAKDTVNDMGSRMVISGVGQGNFEADRDITRAEFAAIVIRALGLAPGDGTSSFTDVSTGDWFCGYVKTAVEQGVITGYDTTTFGPNDKITREQVMTITARAMKITGLNSEMKDSEISGLIANYMDGTTASEYAKTSVAACLKTGVITGRSSDTIAPKDSITRAEVAVIVQRLLQKSDLI